MADKILYISNILENTGYSVAAREVLTCMEQTGIDVVARNIRMTQSLYEPNKLIQTLLEKDAVGCNIVIQHTLPEFFDYNGKFERNIGMFAIETNQIPRFWVKNCKLMDELIVFNNHSKQVLHSHGIYQNIHVLPHPVDINKFSKSISGKGIVGKIKETTDCFVFYSIGEFSPRKNYETLLRAYFTEFSTNDNVRLVIKTSKSGCSPQECSENFHEMIRHVQNNLKLYRYPEVVVLTEFMSEEDIERLHYESDCYITLSHGEAWGLATVDSIGFGKAPIAPWHTGHKDYLKPSSCFPLKQVIEENCYNTGDVNRDLYSGNDTWFGVNINEAKTAMRNVFKNTTGLFRRKQGLGLDSIQHLSYPNVGNLIKNIINGSPHKKTR